MSTLKRQEPLGPGLRRIACEHLEAAIHALTRQAGDARQTLLPLARLDAVLRLIEPALPRPAARRDRVMLNRLRNEVEALCRPAMLLERLDARFKKPMADPAQAEAARLLRKRWPTDSRPELSLGTTGRGFDPMIYRLIADMAELRGHVGEWPADSIDDGPPPGLRRTYQRARKLADAPHDRRDVAALCDAVGALNQQLATITKCCPPMIKGQRKLLSAAADLLHEADADHRLADALREQAAGSLDVVALNGLLELTHPPHNLELSLRYALTETAAAFSQRIAGYWSLWRGNQR